MKELLLKIENFWGRLFPRYQKIVLAFLIISSCLIANSLWKKESKYTALAPGKKMNAAEKSLISDRLKNNSIPFKMHPKKGLMVSQKLIDKARDELKDLWIDKPEPGKGFELFDTNTWIKGEKELQVMEMRALKGQLEKDLAAFDHIKSASVILDIPPQKSFHHHGKYQTKASVILTLMPNAKIQATELKAIANHLAGAVRGLEPSMIAISDTTGKLYQSIYADEALSLIQTTRDFEEQIEEKLYQHLKPIVGEKGFHISVKAFLNPEKLKLETLSVGIVIDSNIKDQMSAFSEEIASQITNLTNGYGVVCTPVVSYIPFERPNQSQITERKKSIIPAFFFFFFIAAAIGAIVFSFFKRQGFSKENTIGEKKELKPFTHVDLKRLSLSIQGENPKTIATLLSYLEPEKADAMMAAWDLKLQQEVLFHLSELEKGGG